MQIERHHWNEFFADLSRRAVNSVVSIEVMSTQLGDQVDEHDVLLDGIEFDPRDGIVVSMADRGNVVVRHAIPNPIKVQVVDTPGVPQAVMVEAADGTRTLLHLAPPV